MRQLFTLFLPLLVSCRQLKEVQGFNALRLIPSNFFVIRSDSNNYFSKIKAKCSLLLVRNLCVKPISRCLLKKQICFWRNVTKFIPTLRWKIHFILWKCPSEQVEIFRKSSSSARKKVFLDEIISLKLLKQVKIENKTARRDFLTRRKPHFVVFKRFSAFLDLFDIHLKSSIDAIDRPILRTWRKILEKNILKYYLIRHIFFKHCQYLNHKFILITSFC